MTEKGVRVAGKRIRVIEYLQKKCGRGRWRKLKGTTKVKLPNGKINFLIVEFSDEVEKALMAN